MFGLSAELFTSCLLVNRIQMTIITRLFLRVSHAIVSGLLNVQSLCEP